MAAVSVSFSRVHCVRFLLFRPKGSTLEQQPANTPEPVLREGRSSVLKAHTGTVRCVNFSADGKLLITAGDDKTVKVRHTQYLCSIPLCLTMSDLILVFHRSTYMHS